MKTAEEVELSESQIAVHWREEEYFYPPVKFIGQANASDPSIFDSPQFLRILGRSCHKRWRWIDRPLILAIFGTGRTQVRMPAPVFDPAKQQGIPVV